MSQPAGPPPIAYEAQPVADVDTTHLNILAICYWVWGGLTALFSSFGLIHLGMGIAMLNGSFPMPTPTTGPSAAPFPNQLMGWMFTIIGGAIVSYGWIVGGLTVYAGFSLKRQRKWMLCMVMAALNCISIPIGTALGVLTIIVLVRPRVKRMFASNSPVAQ